MSTTQPEPIESYALRVAEACKIGCGSQDNGALFLIAKNDKKMRIEVGYSLEALDPCWATAARPIVHARRARTYDHRVRSGEVQTATF